MNMTALLLPYATWNQATSAFEHFNAGSGQTVETEGELFELMTDEANGFCVWFSRQDETGDHIAIMRDEAQFIGLPL